MIILQRYKQRLRAVPQFKEVTDWCLANQYGIVFQNSTDYVEVNWFGTPFLEEYSSRKFEDMLEDIRQKMLEEIECLNGFNIWIEDSALDYDEEAEEYDYETEACIKIKFD